MINVFKVIEMAEIEGPTPELAITFFKKKVYLSVKEYQVGCTNLELDATESGEPLITDLLIKCKSFISFAFKHYIHTYLYHAIQYNSDLITSPKPVYFD